MVGSFIKNLRVKIGHDSIGAWSEIGQNRIVTSTLINVRPHYIEKEGVPKQI